MSHIAQATQPPTGRQVGSAFDNITADPCCDEKATVSPIAKNSGLSSGDNAGSVAAEQGRLGKMGIGTLIRDNSSNNSRRNKC